MTPALTLTDRTESAEGAVAPMVPTVVITSRPHGLDRLVMRLSLAALLWAQRHADRTTLTSEQHAHLVAQERALAVREHAMALLAARIR